MHLFAPLLRIRRRLRRHLWSDVVIVSYPKSGRTWLRVMLDELEMPIAQTHAGAKRPNLPDRREFSGRRVVLLVRDPRDTVVSAFHQETKRVDQKYPSSISDFIREPRMGLERIVEFNLGWISDHGIPRQFHLIEYENLRANTEGELDKLLDFIGRRTADQSAVRRAIEMADFDRLQKLERQGALQTRYGESLKPRDVSDPNSLKVRKGKVGGFREELSEADISYCAEVMGKHNYAKRLADFRRDSMGSPTIEAAKGTQ